MIECFGLPVSMRQSMRQVSLRQVSLRQVSMRQSMRHVSLRQSMRIAAGAGRLARCLVASAWAIACLSTNAAIGQQRAAPLADEGKLPGQAVRAADLPDESTLPGQGVQGGGQTLPPENQLPTGEVPDPATVVQNELAPIAGKVPILRLAFDGHTGIIRTLDLDDDGRTLVSAGEDKDVHVWRRTDIGDTGWLHRRTIRWPVTRGPRGRIYATALKNDLLAFAGHGAYGSLGEIRVVDVANGDLQRTLVEEQGGHRQNILALAWSPSNPPTLASLDMSGQLMKWGEDPTSGLWTGRVLEKDDQRTFNAQIAAALQLGGRREFVGLTFAGPHTLVWPRFVGAAEQPPGAAKWHPLHFNLSSGGLKVLSDFNHIVHVRALASTPQGHVLASCDGTGSIGVWRFKQDGAQQSFHRLAQPSTPALSIDLSRDGRRLLVGTLVHNGTAKIQLWDAEATPPRLISDRDVADPVRAVAIDGKRGEAIIAVGSQIQIHPYDVDGKFSESKTLTVPARPIQKVAFANSGENYRVGFGWNRNEQGEKKLEGVFDLTDSKLLGRGPIDSDDFVQAQQTATRWQVQKYEDNQLERFRLVEGNEPRGTLPFIFERNGTPTTVCTLPAPRTGNEDPGASRTTGAVIVGTSGRNGIYAYRPNDADQPELIRQFRDHSGAVLSVSTSADGRYLVSGGADATISVWNLQDMFTVSKMVNRWGCEFEIEGGQLIATEVREDGPLFFRGVRGGDRLSRLSWTDREELLHDVSEPTVMRQRLLDLAFDQMVELKFARLGRLGPHFQSFPAWRPLATLFVDQTREWAYWTPSGYYDASFNGHQKFGWQINHQRDREVDYFRAAQFRQRLERGDIMRRLLEAGSLSAAMRMTVSQMGPPPAEGAIVNQIESRPTIELLEPDASQIIEGDTLTVRAEIRVPLGATLIPPKAFVSGVPAVQREVVANRDEAAEGAVTYQWDFRLPRDRDLQLEVLAATEAEAIDRVLVDLQHRPPPAAKIKPRLHVLAIGASEYRDPQIQSLDFAAKAAGDVSRLFRNRSDNLYRTTADQLVNTDATRPLWRVFAQNAADQLSETVSADDLVIMYLCGHGLRDRRTNQWYFVTADARYGDLMNDQYDDCLAFSDLAALAKLPCRKLAILDSCHSGAVQPVMGPDDLKSALRFLQDDVVLTITASEGDEEAAEQRETRLGRFTTALIDALQGQAPELDEDPDTVSLGEVVAYVKERVSRESELEGMPQHPTASPAYLLKTLQLPLTSR